MGGEVLKLPRIKLPKPKLPALPRPRFWDLVALGVTTLTLVAAGANLALVEAAAPGARASGGLTTAFVLTQLTLGLVSLMLLGKTAKEGTIWGNLAAVGGMFLGISGVLLAAALWAAA